MPEFNNGKVRIAEERIYQELEKLPGLEMGNPQARRWLSQYAVALGLDAQGLLRMLLALGIQRLRQMGEEELDTIAAVTGKGVSRVRGSDEPEW